MRTATVTYSMRERDSVPMIRLRGKWLEHAGFREGTRLQVEVTGGKLTLTLAEGQGSRDNRDDSSS